MKGVYIMGGFPTHGRFSECFDAAVKAGFDFIEAGIPFNDPVADGPVIAKAAEESIFHGTTVETVISDMEKFKDLPVKKYFMTYANIVYHYGIKKFSDRVKPFTTGIIIADMPNRSTGTFEEKGFEIPIVPFATLETREKDMDIINRSKSDVIYFVGLRGTTGGKADFKSEEILRQIEMIKKNTSKKIIIGFGIKTHEDAVNACSITDGYVVGTEAVKRQHDINDYKKYLNELMGK